MNAIGSIIILLWLLFGFCELWLLMNQQKKDWRTSFMGNYGVSQPFLSFGPFRIDFQLGLF
jgi:hypothetical protein